jgi:YVTN family beta-propeller protein
MVDLPQGTVTFLFTDVEGSTRLLRQLGERYGEVLADHRRILREAAERQGGREVDTQGDSFFFAFGRANAAVAAAVEAQRTLADHAWPASTDLRVRMGLHTGEPAVGDDSYVGLDVHRAARIGASAHGGQVLLSSTTRELLEAQVGGISVRALGSYRLKDFDEPERLSQLDIEGLPHEFPPVRAEKVEPPRSPPRRAILLSALAGVVAAAVAIPVFALGRGGSAAPIAAAAGDSVAFVDTGSRHLLADPLVGATPTSMAVGAGAIWVANSDGDSVSRIDPATMGVIQTIQVGNGPSAIATGGGAVWVANSLDGTVSRIDPGTNQVVQQHIGVGNGPVGIVYARGTVWVADSGDGTIARINAASGKRAGEPLPIAATQLAYGAGSLWAVERQTNQVVRIDPETGKAEAPITVGDGPAGIVVGKDGSVWVANSLDGTVTRIDPDTNTPAATVPNVGDGPSGVAVSAAGVWVSNAFDGTLALISPRTDQVTRRIPVGDRPQGVAVSNGNVLVAVRQSGRSHGGGTLKIRMSNFVDQIDFAVADITTEWPFERMTGDGLVAFDQASGLAGTQLVPDLAVSLPAPTDGGRTYKFRLRPDIRFSNGKPLRAVDVLWTFERYYRVGALPVTFYDAIVGGAQCAKRPKRCSLSRGIEADDAAGTVTFHLTAPDPEFLYKLALPFGYVVPAGTPAHDVETRSLPSTGPYTIATFHGPHDFTLTRNRFFDEWSKAAQPDGYPDEIVVHVGGSGNEQFRSVVAGKTDLVSNAFSANPASHELALIKTRNTSQVHENPAPGTQGLFLNTRVAPFDNLDARRAVNYAIDRARMVSYAGGTDLAATTCQILPPDFPGYRPYCPYTASPSSGGIWSAPDLAQARALVARSGTRGMAVTVWTTPAVSGFGAAAVKTLRMLGYRVSTKSVSNADYFGDIGNSHNRPQVSFWGWSADYPAASDFFTTLFTCASFLPDNADNANYSEFCNTGIDKLIGRSLREEAVNTQASNQDWAHVDQALVDQAVVVPLVNTKIVDVVSKRVGNYQYSANGFGVLIDQLWVR